MSSFEESGAIGFAINGEIVLKINNFTKEECEVTEMNLYPIGLAIRGNQSGLKIGGSTFSRNTFDGPAVMFGLG